MSEEAGRANPKPPSVDRLSLLWRRINDHKMVQWSVAYIALAYAIQHGVVLTHEAFEWPQAVERISMLLLVLGLPLVMTFAWYHGARASRQFTKAELSILSALLVIGSLLFYAFVQPSEQIAAGPRPAVQQASIAAGTAKPAGISIAVLPFVNLSGDTAQEFFSDGMTEEITSALAKIPNMRVVGRTSAFEFKGQNKDLRAIGLALSATHLIEGSVRKDGNQLRITAQLIKADDGTHLWTESYDRELKGVFAVQEDIATAIAGALQVPLGLKQGETLVSNRTSDLVSYEQYLRARALVRARAPDKAIAILEPLVVRDSGFAPAWAMLARAYRSLVTYDPVIKTGTVEEARRFVQTFSDKAEVAAKRAIELDSKHAGGYAALALATSSKNNWAAKDDLYKQALSLDANDPDVLSIYALNLAGAGRLKEALRVAEQVRMLEPFVPSYNTGIAEIMQYNGMNAASIPVLEAIAADDPAYYRNLDLAQAYAAEGRYAQAADALLAIKGNDVSRRSVEDAARLLRQAPAKVASPNVLPALEGRLDFVYAYIGASGRIMDNPERGLETGTGAGTALWLPVHATVRKTERFKTYVRKAGLVDYWRARGWPDHCRPMGADDFVCD